MGDNGKVSNLFSVVFKHESSQNKTDEYTHKIDRLQEDWVFAESLVVTVSALNFFKKSFEFKKHITHYDAILIDFLVHDQSEEERLGFL